MGGGISAPMVKAASVDMAASNAAFGQALDDLNTLFPKAVDEFKFTSAEGVRQLQLSGAKTAQQSMPFSKTAVDSVNEMRKFMGMAPVSKSAGMGDQVRALTEGLSANEYMSSGGGLWRTGEGGPQSLGNANANLLSALAPRAIQDINSLATKMDAAEDIKDPAQRRETLGLLNQQFESLQKQFSNNYVVYSKDSNIGNPYENVYRRNFGGDSFSQGAPAATNMPAFAATLQSYYDSPTGQKIKASGGDRAMVEWARQQFNIDRNKFLAKNPGDNLLHSNLYADAGSPSSARLGVGHSLLENLPPGWVQGRGGDIVPEELQDYYQKYPQGTIFYDVGNGPDQQSRARTAEAANAVAGKTLSQLQGLREQFESKYAIEPERGYTGQEVMDQLSAVPEYQFALKQGGQAMERTQAAKGMLGSGNALIEATQFGKNLAETAYANHMQRLAGLAGINMPVTQQNLGNQMAMGGQLQQAGFASGQQRSGLLSQQGQSLAGVSTAQGNMLGQAGIQQAQMQTQASIANQQASMQAQQANQQMGMQMAGMGMKMLGGLFG